LLAGVEVAEEGEAFEAATLADRAARLPDPGGDALAAALGELVAYLEFELVNHPKLADASGVMRGLEPLRRAASQ
jgi:hypothetical protein